MKPLTDRLTTTHGIGLAALGRPSYITLGHAADLNHAYDVAAICSTRTKSSTQRATYGRAE